MRTTATILMLCVSASALAGPKKKAPEAAPAATTPYVSVSATKTQSEEFTDLLGRADELLKELLATYKVEVAPEGEDEKAAAAAIKAKHAEGLSIQLTLSPIEGGGMKGSMLISKYPAGGLKGAWTVSASGASVGEMLEQLLPKAIEDAAGDLGWKKK